VRAGGAVFHNGLVVHGAGANMTPRWRRAMTCAYMPEGATYNGQPHWVLGKEWLEELQVGDPLDDESVLPRAYPR
jgi:ectoine hydroxylase-related dioxygenase (phytanoyl-CoA dioxygenase family)